MTTARSVLRELWWWLRGVEADQYREVCSRCWRTGQSHWQVSGCRRFKRQTPKVQRRTP